MCYRCAKNKVLPMYQVAQGVEALGSRRRSSQALTPLLPPLNLPLLKGETLSKVLEAPVWRAAWTPAFSSPLRPERDGI